MSLASVVRGKQEAPDRVLLYGVEGIGKSTWAAGAPAPVFIPAEDGTSNLDVARFPEPDGWVDVLDALRILAEDKHDFQTVVLDTLDAVEPMLWRHICERDKKSSIEDYGYGKGYMAALDEWRVFLAALEKLRRTRGLGVVLIAHSWIRPFKNPEGDDFDRYELKLNAKAGGLLKEWCDSVLFAHYETYASKNERTGAVKGVSTGARVVHTQRTAAWDAKNRFSLPESLPLDYADYAAAVKAHRPADPSALRESIQVKLDELADNEITAKVAKAVAEAKDDAEKLALINNRMTATLRARKGA
jgi:hypothetical protein